jgi:ParB/RepB/Spo0J family partition protein
MAIVDVEREAPVAEPEPEVSRETYEGLLLDGETPEEALQRLEKTRGYQKLIGSDAGQALLAAATAQTASIPNGGVRRKSKAAARAEVLAATDPTADELEELGIPIELQVAVAAGEAEEDEPDDPEAEPLESAPLMRTPDPKGTAVEAFRAKVAEYNASAHPDATPGGLAGPIGRLAELRIGDIEVSSNVRKDLGDLAELAASIRDHGLLEPITVTALYSDGVDMQPTGYRVLTGHRRLAAVKLLEQDRIRVIVDPRFELGEAGSGRSVIQLMENIQRADINAIDTAEAIQALQAARPALTHADIAGLVHKDRTWVTNMLRLLETAPEVQAAVRAETVSPTHARAIAGVDVDLQARLLDSVIDRSLSAHETEDQAKYFKNQAKAIRDRAAKIEALAAKAIASLEKVTSHEKADIGLADYGGTSSDLRDALEKAGWKVSDGYSWTKIKNAGECGCEGVWRVEVSYQGAITVGPACHNNDHEKTRRAELEATWKRDQAKANDERRAEREAAEAAIVRSKGAIGEILARRPASTLARRLVVWGLLVADEDVDEQLVAKYIDDGAVERFYAVEDAAWMLAEAIPEAELDDVQAALVARLFGSYVAGPAVKAAVDAWAAEAHPETLELGEPEAKAGRKRLGKEVRLQDPVVVAGVEYLVIGITYPGQEPSMTERPPAIVELGIRGAVKPADYRLHRVPLADLTADTKERVWRAAEGALQVTKPASHGEARDAAIIEAAVIDALECVGSNHIPGCAHQGGEIPPARPAAAV